MTPQDLRDIYHAARVKAMRECSDYANPIKQDQCDLKGWEAVMGAMSESNRNR